MKPIVLAAAAAVICQVSAFAQKPEPNEQQKAVAAAVREMQAQQVKMAGNQAQIDAKLATLGEALRQARIFTSRAGH